MSLIRKLIGLLLLIAAVVGLIFSVAGISVLWRVEENISTGIQSTVDLLSQTLETTSQGLEVTNSALEGSVTTIRSLQTTVETIATTVTSSTPMVSQIGVLMDEVFPDTIESTKNSLQSAAESAKVIDSMLSTFSSIPLIGATLSYDPDVPLSESLGGVATSLETLPDSFRSMSKDLEATTTNLNTFETDLSTMAESIGAIESSVAQYGNVIGGYKGSLDQIQSRLDLVKQNIPTITRYLLIALTVFLGWMAIANLGLMTQGWELLTESRPTRKEENEPELEKEASEPEKKAEE